MQHNSLINYIPYKRTKIIGQALNFENHIKTHLQYFYTQSKTKSDSKNT